MSDKDRQMLINQARPALPAGAEVRQVFKVLASRNPRLTAEITRNPHLGGAMSPLRRSRTSPTVRCLPVESGSGRCVWIW